MVAASAPVTVLVPMPAPRREVLEAVAGQIPGLHFLVLAHGPAACGCPGIVHLADISADDEKAARAAARTRRDEAYVPYVYDDDLILAIQTAQVAERPLLLLGDPGSGKSTLARDVALGLGHRYYEHVVTSRMQARDLLWRFDAVRRLSDDPDDRSLGEWRYVEPGRLWWAFDPDSAARRGGDAVPLPDPAWGAGNGPGAVLLIDEIDKADPDVPNDLLVAFGESRFRVDELDREIVRAAQREVLLFVTSNEERDLPQAFLRRCVVIRLATPTGKDLRTIVDAHFPGADAGMVTAVMAELERLAVEMAKSAPRPPGTAELLDAVRACQELGIATADDPRLARVLRATVWKPIEKDKARG